MINVTPKMKFGLALDWETSGSAWDKDSTVDYQGISYAAVIFDLNTFEEIETQTQSIKFDSKKYKWSPEAEAIHGRSREDLEKNGVAQQDAAVELLELIAKYFGSDKPTVIFLGHNATFDIRFTDQLFRSVGFSFSIEKPNDDLIWVKIFHVVLDTSSLGLITLGEYKSEPLFQKIGCPPRNIHNPMEDIENTLSVCKIVKELVKCSLENLL